MKGLLFYLLQVIASSGLLYGYYHLFLRNKKFHQYNRYYLLLSAVASILVPFLDIPVYFSHQQPDAAWLQTWSDMSSPVLLVASTKGADASSFFTWNNFPAMVYALAVVFLLVRLAMAFLRIKALLAKYKAEKFGDIYFVNTEEKGTPFSFFKWMFWNNKIALQSENGQQMFRHELFHIKEKHSWDIVFMELLTIILWMNPFFYLFRRELKVIHEFLADQFAVKENDQWNYAELLLMHLLDCPHLRLTNPFFHNQIKRRIAMITSSKQPRYQYFRKLLVLPLLAIIAVLFAFTYRQKQETISKTDTGPVFATTHLQSQLQPADSTPRGRNVIIVGGKKKTGEVKEEKVILIEKEIIIEEEISEEEKEVKGNLIIRTKTEGEEPLYVVDGKVIKKQDLNDVKPNTIKSISILKNSDGTALYGDKARHGVVHITTKKGEKVSAEILDPQLDESRAEETKEDLKEVVVVGYALGPQFPGGVNEWRKFLERNLNSMVPVNNGAPAGLYKVIVEFTVDEKGAVSDLRPISENGFGMEEEVIRTLRSGPNWIPASKEGKPVRSIRRQPVAFIVEDADQSKSLKEVVVVGQKKQELAQPEMDKLKPIYPNPANNNVTVPYNAATGGAGELRVTDMKGNTQLVLPVKLAQGMNTLDVNVSSLAKGLYLITVIEGAGKPARVYKMVKQ